MSNPRPPLSAVPATPGHGEAQTAGISRLLIRSRFSLQIGQTPRLATTNRRPTKPLLELANNLHRPITADDQD
jgi:hypothetical protein